MLRRLARCWPLAWILALGCGAPAGSTTAGPTEFGTDGASSTGTSDGDDTSATSDALVPGDDVVFTIVKGAHLQRGEEDDREVEVTLNLPGASLDYASIELALALACPGGTACDKLSRRGALSVVVDPGAGVVQDWRIRAITDLTSSTKAAEDVPVGSVLCLYWEG